MMLQEEASGLPSHGVASGVTVFYSGRSLRIPASGLLEDAITSGRVTYHPTE